MDKWAEMGERQVVRLQSVFSQESRYYQNHSGSQPANDGAVSTRPRRRQPINEQRPVHWKWDVTRAAVTPERNVGNYGPDRPLNEN